MLSRNKIYTILVLEKVKKDPRLLINTYGCQRLWGFYFDKNDAIKALHCNNTDMWESCYDYAVLEEYPEGICRNPKSVQWYKYDQDKDGYFEIDTPDGECDFVGHAMG